MEHLSQMLLGRVFGGVASGPEADDAVSHLSSGCRSCWNLAARVIADLSSQGKLAVVNSTGPGAVVKLMREEHKRLYERLRARAHVAGLKGQAPKKQAEALHSTRSFQTSGMFSTLLEEARRLAATESVLAEHNAHLALILVECLDERYSEKRRNDLRGEAWTAIANCRRLAADLKGAGAAIIAARNLLAAGTGDAQAEARLLSIQASLAADTGRIELARGLLGRARELYNKERDWAGVARVSVQEASALQEFFPEEALDRASEALRLLRESDTRLTMYAKSITTESLIVLRQIPDALRNFEETRPLYEQFPEPRVQIRVQFIEARLLEAGEYIREAEKLYSEVILAFTEAELYKDSFITRLVLFDFYVRRDRMDRAADVLREAVKLMEKLGIAHEQMLDVWRHLLLCTEQQRLDRATVETFRAYVLRHWNAPALRAPFKGAA